MSEKLLAYAAYRRVAVPPLPHTAEVLGELAASVYFKPSREGRKVPRELDYLATARAFRLPTQAGELAAWEWGEAGRPLVGLLHGWQGHGAQLGAFAAPLVAAGFRVLTFDAPAHGESPGDECSAPLIGRIVLESEAHVGRFHSFVAHSMGAAAAAMAATHGAHPRGMVFLAPPLSQLERITEMAERAKLSPAVSAAFEQAVARRAGLSLEESDMEWVAPRAHCPLLALHDPADTETSFAATAGFVSRWTGARLVACPGRGHFRLLSTPDVVRQTVAFLASFQ
jgi:pimeloyl-ACP methyl ester carboxylesterase